MRSTVVLIMVSFATSPAHAERSVRDAPLSRGTIFVGASVGAMVTPTIQAVSATPVFGWFIADRVSLGTLASVTVLSDGAPSPTMRATLWSALVEPAYHAPVARQTFAVLGMGVGTAWAKGLGGQLVIAPRLGLHVRVGTSGVLTSAVAFRYVTHGQRDDPRPVDDALTQGMQLELGYLASW